MPYTPSTPCTELFDPLVRVFPVAALALGDVLVNL